ncbi:MAG: LptF/LptG family permease [Flavobacteriales bacterium]
MIKKLDLYFLKAFIGRFIVVFGILFFLFLLSFVWQKLAAYTGRGASFLIIAKAIFYLGVSIVRMVLPLSILLTTIMTFGELGERYELAAIRSTGTSLWRTMRSLFIFSILCAFISFIFSDSIATDAFKKARNLQSSILRSQAALALKPGIFSDISGYPIRIENKEGEKLQGVYLFMQENANSDQRIIIADHGTLINHDSLPIVVLTLYNGYIYQEEIKGLPSMELRKQPGNKIAFDSLVQRFNIKDLLSQDISEEGDFNNHYQMLTITELSAQIDTLKNQMTKYYTTFETTTTRELFATTKKIDSLNPSDLTHTNKLLYKNYDFNRKERIINLEQTLQQFDRIESTYFENREEQIEKKEQIENKYILEQYNRFVYAFECIMMFLIAAPLGAIIRKGGLGIPLVVGITVFIVFFLLENSGRIWAIEGTVPHSVGALLPVIVLFPLSIYLTIKANNDSEVFNQDKYFEPFRKLYRKFKPEKIHKRYQ